MHATTISRLPLTAGHMGMTPVALERWIGQADADALFELETELGIYPDLDDRLLVIETLHRAGRAREAAAHAEVARWALDDVRHLLDSVLEPAESEVA